MPLRLRPDIATTDTDDGLVLLDEATGRYWQLNPTGAHVLHALIEGHPPERIAADLARDQRSCENYRREMASRFATWNKVVGLPTAA